MRPPRPGPAASFIVSVIIVTLLRILSAYRVSQETVGQRMTPKGFNDLAPRDAGLLRFCPRSCRECRDVRQHPGGDP
jgi:hypothetical protein